MVTELRSNHWRLYCVTWQPQMSLAANLSSSLLNRDSFHGQVNLLGGQSVMWNIGGPQSGDYVNVLTNVRP
jgi:hypothetical protein